MQVQRNFFAGGHALVVVEGIFAQRFVVRGGEGIAANFEQLRRGEKLHVGGVAEDGIYQRALLHDGRGQAPALAFEGASQAHGAGPNYKYIKHISSLGLELARGFAPRQAQKSPAALL